jgi:hypothetical protein
MCRPHTNTATYAPAYECNLTRPQAKGLTSEPLFHHACQIVINNIVEDTATCHAEPAPRRAGSVIQPSARLHNTRTSKFSMLNNSPCFSCMLKECLLVCTRKHGHEKDTQPCIHIMVKCGSAGCDHSLQSGGVHEHPHREYCLITRIVVYISLIRRTCSWSWTSRAFRSDVLLKS